MADSPSNVRPWYETLKGIRRNGRGSPSSKVSPINGDIEAGSVKSEPFFSADQIPSSSFNFSKSAFQFQAPPPDSSAKAPKALNNGAAHVPPTKETAPTSPGQLRPTDQPVLSPLSPAPAAKASEKKDLEIPMMRDFEYHPKPEARLYPLVKYDLGPEEEKSKRRRCLCWTLTTVLVILVALGIVAGVLAVKLNPKTPSLSIGDLGVTCLAYSEGNGPQLAVEMHFSFNLRNPNNFAKVIYGEISASPFFEQLGLGRSAVPGFVQGKRSTDDLTAAIPLTVTSVPSDTVDPLKAEVQNSDVQIDLRGSVNGKFSVLGLKVKHFSIPISCQLNVKPGDGDVQPTILQNSCFDQE